MLMIAACCFWITLDLKQTEVCCHRICCYHKLHKSPAGESQRLPTTSLKFRCLLKRILLESFAGQFYGVAALQGSKAFHY